MRASTDRKGGLGPTGYRQKSSLGAFPSSFASCHDTLGAFPSTSASCHDTLGAFPSTSASCHDTLGAFPRASPAEKDLFLTLKAGDGKRTAFKNKQGLREPCRSTQPLRLQYLPITFRHWHSSVPAACSCHPRSFPRQAACWHLQAVALSVHWPGSSPCRLSSARRSYFAES